MNTTVRGPQAPESYATFWEPLTPTATPPAPADARTSDAYQEFTELTEGAFAAPRRERT